MFYLPVKPGGAFVELLYGGGNGLEAIINKLLLLIQLLAGSVLKFLEFVTCQIEKLALIIGKGLA